MRTTVHIQNLECCGSKRILINNLTNAKNITDVEVNIENNTVSFDFHTKHDFENAKHILSRIGYPIVGKENKLKNQSIR